MKLILSPKDNVGKMTLENVQGFALEGETLLVVFDNGRTRNYPLQHLWYYESHVEYHRTSSLVPEATPEDVKSDPEKKEFLTEEAIPATSPCGCRQCQYSVSRCT